MTPRKSAPKPKARPKTTRPQVVNLGSFRTRNRALVAGIRVKALNTTYPSSSITLNFSKDGFANASLGWLANLMELYDLFRIESLDIEWVPSASSFTTGAIAWYYDPSPGAKAPKTFEGASGNANLVTTQVARAKRAKVPTAALTSRLPWVLTDSSDPTTGSQGTLVIVLSEGNIPSATGDVYLGSFWMTYTIALKNPTYIAPAVYDEHPVTPLIDQLVLDELIRCRELLIRQVEAQEQTAEDVSIIAAKPGIPAGVGGDVSAAATRLASIDSILRSYNIGGIHSAASASATSLSSIERAVDRMDIGGIHSAASTTATTLSAIERAVNRMDVGGIATSSAASAASLSSLDRNIGRVDVGALNTVTTRLTESNGVIRRVNGKWNVGTAYSTEGRLGDIQEVDEIEF